MRKSCLDTEGNAAFYGWSYRSLLCLAKEAGILLTEQLSEKTGLLAGVLDKLDIITILYRYFWWH